MNGSKLEITVGLFVLIGLIILASVVFGISGAYFLRSGYHVYAMFNSVSDLNPGSAVRLAGVSVGEIKGIEIAYDEVTQRPQAKVELFILSETKLRENYRFRIQGIYSMTEAFLQIEPGDNESAPLLKDGSIVIGEDPTPFEDIVERGKEMITDFEQTAKYAKRILARLDKGEGTMGKLLVDETLYDEAIAFVQELRARPWRLLKRDEKRKMTEEEMDKAKSLTV